MIAVASGRSRLAFALVIAVAAVMVSAGVVSSLCLKKETPVPAASPPPPVVVPAPIAVPAPPPSVTGIEACDRYLERVAQVMECDNPPRTEGATLDQLREALIAAAAGVPAEDRHFIADACAQQTAALTGGCGNFKGGAAAGVELSR